MSREKKKRRRERKKSYTRIGLCLRLEGLAETSHLSLNIIDECRRGKVISYLLENLRTR